MKHIELFLFLTIALCACSKEGSVVAMDPFTTDQFSISKVKVDVNGVVATYSFSADLPEPVSMNSMSTSMSGISFSSVQVLTSEYPDMENAMSKGFSILVDPVVGQHDYVVTSGGLVPGRTYYSRVVVTNSGGMRVWSDPVSFVAGSYSDSTRKIGDHMAVDLGLSVLWADSNLDGYYSWGETEPKIFCGIDNYSIEEVSDFKDAAEVQWGNGWRMPTASEAWELGLMSDITFTASDAVLQTESCKRALILPLNGYKHNANVECKGSFGYYLTSTTSPYVSLVDLPFADLNHYFYMFYLTDRKTGDAPEFDVCFPSYYYEGCQVRPVHDR